MNGNSLPSTVAWPHSARPLYYLSLAAAETPFLHRWIELDYQRLVAWGQDLRTRLDYAGYTELPLTLHVDGPPDSSRATSDPWPPAAKFYVFVEVPGEIHAPLANLHIALLDHFRSAAESGQFILAFRPAAPVARAVQDRDTQFGGHLAAAARGIGDCLGQPRAPEDGAAATTPSTQGPAHSVLDWSGIGGLPPAVARGDYRLGEQVFASALLGLGWETHEFGPLGTPPPAAAGATAAGATALNSLGLREHEPPALAPPASLTCAALVPQPDDLPPLYTARLTWDPARDERVKMYQIHVTRVEGDGPPIQRQYAVSVGEGPTIRIHDLPPGRYAIYLRALGDQGARGPAGPLLTLTVPSPLPVGASHEDGA